VHDLTLLQDLAVVFLVAGVAAVVCRRLAQPVLLGYLLAGLIIGPNTPPFMLVRDPASVRALADLGVVFLLFGLGLEFSLSRLRRVGPSAAVAAALEMSLMLWLGYEAGRLAGFGQTDSLFVGAIVSLSSSTVATALFREKGLMRTAVAQVVFGILIAEDVLVILLLVLLSGIALSGAFEFGALAVAVARLAAFAAVTLGVGLLVVPRLVAFVASTRRDEVLLIASLGFGFGLALAADSLGLSVALGAFAAGAVLAETPEARRIERLVAPVRDLFGAVFFVAIGMLIDPALLVRQAPLVIGLVVVVVVGKSLAVAVGGFVTGLDLRTSFRAGLSMGQIGEFSFIIAQLGQSLGVIGPQLYATAVAVSAVTIFLSPHLIDRADRIVETFEWLAPPRLVRALDRYTRRIGQLTAPSHRASLWRLLRRSVVIVAINVAAITLLFGVAAVAARWIARRVGPSLWVTGDVHALAWLAAALLALPFFVATWRKAEAIVMIVAEAALPRRRGGQGDPGGDRVRRQLVRTLLVVVSAAMVAWLIAVSAPLVPRSPVFLVPVVIVALLLPVLWTTMLRFYTRMQGRIEDALRETRLETPEGRAALVDLLAGERALGAHVVEVEVTAGSAPEGRTIGELGIRQATGVFVLEVHRRGTSIVNPGPDLRLLAGDALMLFGREAELDAARRLLGATDEGVGGGALRPAAPASGT
jgi:CPA2 family monovalent cation:H+ antiporter-2